MLNRLFTLLFGSRNDRVLRRCWKQVHLINQREAEYQAHDDARLKSQTELFKDRLAKGETVEDLLPEAFALVREASRRVLNMRHFDVQLIGGMVLHGGNIAEMRTGEGKTLMSTLAVYLNALQGKGVHVVTMNDYLVQRDAEWMRPLYEFLGLSVGINLPTLSPEQKREAYAADITYSTNNELGFDYLRDNMVFSIEEKVQRKPYFAIVDEVDSILIDEARTPLIISGPSSGQVELYQKINAFIPSLQKQAEENGAGDFSLDEKSKQVNLSDEGHEHIEQLLKSAGLLQAGESLYDANNIILMHHIYASLRAHHLFHRDIDYIVQRDEVVIVDEHTGRTMPGRRWSDGLHQAIEAKEQVKIHPENQTMASITFQNYFRLYEKLSGMTGTADTEAYEFQQIYQLEVTVIPTHKKMVRKDLPDFVFMSTEEKLDAIVKDIQETHVTGQPILVGTTSIETSEVLSNLLTKAKIPHQVLNAKFHEREAHIIAEAGRPGAVTIATNMAGRGTDIVLGGNLSTEIQKLQENGADENALKECEQSWRIRHDQVIEAGGLYVLGTERHESRRIDNQLRGRSGRQGDPGRSRFYLSIQDNLLRIFGGNRLSMFKLEKGAALESRLLSRSIENAQRRVESHHFDVRKQLLEYDDIANEQRRIIYEKRDEILQVDSVQYLIDEKIEDVLTHVVQLYVPEHSIFEQWDLQGLQQTLENEFNLPLPLTEWIAQENSLDEEKLLHRIQTEFLNAYQAKEERIGSDRLRAVEKAILLQLFDHHWREHLAAMDYLRQGIHLRGYAQKNPKQEYKREAFLLFANMIQTMDYKIITQLAQLDVMPETMPQDAALTFSHEAPKSDFDASADSLTSGSARISRNALCPCGSGKKYKSCHGSLV